ncbi:MAG TPA: ABC transporter ATP-binding protein [Thermoplasmata archaeon]|nr:ABC transporter ATP-binding protein [Thermoplasmata archaeon]
MVSGPEVPSAAPPDIELIEVSRRFKETSAVDRVSLTVPRGAFYSLLGPSGCGKTTTLRIIAGLEGVDEGEVRLRGVRVNEVPPFKRDLGMVFQSLALFPHLSVFKNVAYGLRIRRRPDGEIRRRVRDSLALVGLSGFERRSIAKLSGGQQQRVALARAIVTEPTVLLLDEPLGALDLKLRLQMQLELKRIHRQLGTTFVFVTHDQGEALAMSDRIAVMARGRIEQEGTPEDIYHRPRTSFVADFIGETNLLEGSIRDGIVELPGGVTIPLPEQSSAPDGERVSLSIRPESLSVGEPARARQVRWSAVVEETVFRGTNAVVAMKTAEGLRLSALVSSAVAGRIAVGSTVNLGFDLDAVLVFPAMSG